MLDAFGFLIPVLGAEGKVVDFRVEYVNAVGQRYAGLPRERYEGHLITEIFPNAEESGFLAMYRQVWETGEPIVEDEYTLPGSGRALRRGRVAGDADHPGAMRAWPSPGATSPSRWSLGRRSRRARPGSGTWPTTRR
jgi:PAS domain-containing protein